ncbi:hypothetical protein MBANPS3_008089 [Mucor bainieri]
MTSSINKFPSEVLQCIFQYANDVQGMYSSTTRSSICQRARLARRYHLVCKQWRKAAVSVLYKALPLGKRSVLLARTLKRNPHFGAYVKEVTVDDTFLTTRDTYGTMHTILKLCPNIEIIRVEELKVTEVLYPCLMQDHVELKYLKKFTVYDDGECQFQDVMGPFVLLKFCNTLQDISIRLEEASSNRISESRRHFLIKNINKFVELERLHIADIAEITDAVFDQLLDDCPAKLKTLATDSFYMSDWNKPLENVKPQTTLESIRIEEHVDMTVAMLRYLAHKLTGLKELYVRDAFDYPSENEEKDWWTYFLRMGERLDKLTFCTRFSYTNVQYQLEKLAELGVCISKQATNKTLCVNFDEGDNRIPALGLFDAQMHDEITFQSSPQFVLISIHSCKDTDAIQWLKQYAPHEVMITSIENMKEYCNTDFSKLDKRAFFMEISNRKSYTLLSKVFENFGQDNNLGSLAVFDAVFCGISLASLAPRSWGISNLRIANSVISEDFLHEISNKAPQLDTLALEQCSYITEDPFQLKLFLPATRLDRLNLTISSFSQAVNTTLANLLSRTSVKTEQSQMENHDLLAAVSDSGRYTLKIETASKTQVLFREGNKTVATENCSDETLQGWDRLPFEILLKIFKYVNNGKLETIHRLATQRYSSNLKDMKQCQLACKGWARAAQKIMYEQIHLGINLQQFAETITHHNPHLAALTKKVSFGNDIDSTDDCSNCVASVVSRCNNINHLLVCGRASENLVWPWLLLEDMGLNNLEVITNNLYHTHMDLVLYSLLAVKLSATLKTVKISLAESQPTAPLAEMQSYGRIIQRLNSFSSLEHLMITNGNPLNYQTLDQVIDDCSQKLERVTISKLELKEWRKEAIKTNKSIKRLDIASFNIDDSSLSYLVCKFKALDSLSLLSLTYKAKEVAEKPEHWHELAHLCTSVKSFDIGIEYNEATIKDIVDKCLDILQRTESNQRRLRIFTFDVHTPADQLLDFSPPTIENMRMPTVKISKTSTGECSVEISGNTEALKNDILKHMANWIQLYAPTSVDINDSIARARYHRLMSISTRRLPNLKPYFDFMNKSDIKQFLTRECNGKHWDAFNTCLSSTSTSITAYGIVLPNIPPSSSHPRSDQKKSTTREIVIKDSIIWPTIFTEVSKSLPSLKSLRLESNCYLTSQPYTLMISLPSTAIHQLTLSISSTCGDVMPGSRRHPDRQCALESRELQKAVSPSGHYILKIEANGKTYISKRQNGESIGTVDSKPEDVKRGDKDNALIWIRCKAIKRFRICNGEQDLKERQYEELDWQTTQK